MANVAQLVRASGCGSEGRGFKSHHSPQDLRPTGRFLFAFCCYNLRMFIINDDQRGSFIAGIVVVGVIIILGMFWYARQNGGELFDLSGTNTSETEESSQTEATKDSGTSVKSFRAVNDYDAQGKLTISQNEFGDFAISGAVYLPSEFPGTNYFAKLTGESSIPTVEIGKLEKTSGAAFNFHYASTKSIDNYSQVIIYVDGDAARVEGKTLPHNVMVVDL